jgi:hypothetical protein
MKTSDLIQKRLNKDRPMNTISLRLPDDVIDDLKRIAPMLGFSGYQPLIRTYIGKGLRTDLIKLEEEKNQFTNFLDSLRRHGVSDEIIAEAVAETVA